MKISLTLVCVPLLAAFAVLPAQEPGKEKPASDVPAPGQPEQQDPKTSGLITDTAATKADTAIKAIDTFLSEQAVDIKKPGWRLSLKQPPKLTFTKDADYFWHLETAVGAVKIRYFADTAPMHVSSGIYLSRLGYYDGLNFHRIIPGFMAQGGCPSGTGGGSPGYRMSGEFKGGRKHDKPGILSMANAGPNTDGSQFFLTFAPQPGLDGGYTVWGEVVAGQATLKELEKLGTGVGNGMLKSGPKIVRTWIEVVAKPKSAKPDSDTSSSDTSSSDTSSSDTSSSDIRSSDISSSDISSSDTSNEIKSDASKTEKPRKIKKGLVRELSEGGK